MIIFCVYHFLIGRLEAEILLKFGENQWNLLKSWRARIFLLMPIFCDLAWRADTTRPGQCGKKSPPISWPAGCSQSLSNYTRRRQHLQRRTPSRLESQLLWTLPGQNSEKMFCWTYVCGYILSTPIFFYANILSTPIIWWCLYLTALILCRCRGFSLRLYLLNLLLIIVLCIYHDY